MATPSAVARHPQAEELQALARAKGFLAREFLLWLWWRSESDEFVVETRNPTGSGKLRGTVWIDDRIVLESPTGSIHEHIMKGGTPAQSEESAAALAAGKTVKEVKLGLSVEGLGEFSAVVDAEELAPRGLKLPAEESPADAGAVGSAEGSGPVRKPAMPVSLRLDLTNVFVCFIDQLFATFVEERTADDWSGNSATAIRKWIKSRRAESAKVLH